MKLIYEIETEEELYKIEKIHNLLDIALMEEGVIIKKSSLQQDEKPADIMIHDSERKCRVCGCDWFHACDEGCYWVEEDLCSSCTMQEKGNQLSIEEIKALADDTEIYVESVFPHGHNFIGIKKGNRILEPSGAYWSLARDFEVLCTAYAIADNC